MSENLLRSLLQGASNSAASNVSAPVDGIAWLLRKAGLDIQKPVGGSDWMAERGLTAEPQNRLAGMLGEGLGGVAPMLAAAKAPQIAAGVNKMAANAMTPNTMNAQAGMIKTPFGRIPETSKEIEAMHDALRLQLERAGNVVDSGASNVSGSRYLTVKRPDMPDAQVRISNHGDRYSGQMPGGELGTRFSVDPDSGQTIEIARQWLKDSGVSFKKAPPVAAKVYTDEQLASMTGGSSPAEVLRIAKAMGWR